MVSQRWLENILMFADENDEMVRFVSMINNSCHTGRLKSKSPKWFKCQWTVEKKLYRRIIPKPSLNPIQTNPIKFVFCFVSNISLIDWCWF